jgi:hypothetical protein
MRDTFVHIALKISNGAGERCGEVISFTRIAL